MVPPQPGPLQPGQTVSGTAGQADAFEVLVARQGDRIVQVYRMGVTSAGQGFAWVVPVASVPDFLLPREELLRGIDEALRPRFEMDVQQLGPCQNAEASTGAVAGRAAAPTANAGAGLAADAPAVQVLKREAIGPYDAVVLQAEAVGPLRKWLSDNGYEVPGGLDKGLQPYLKSGAKVVAVKIQPQALREGVAPPLGLSFKADKISLPLRLAAVGAAQRSKVIVTVLGDRRAVPTTYRHGVLNEALIDFQQGGENYDEVVYQAMAGAGGRAFVTDGALPMASVQQRMNERSNMMAMVSDRAIGPSPTGGPLGSSLNAEAKQKLLQARSLACDPFGAVATLGELAIDTSIQFIQDPSLPRDEAEASAPACAADAGPARLNPTVQPWFGAFLQRQLPAELKEADGSVDLKAFVAKAAAFRLAGKSLPASFFDAFEAAATQPDAASKAFDELLAQTKYATRLYTLMPPSAMTEDPAFVLAANLPEVSPEHKATLEILCGPEFTLDNAPRAIRLPSGEAYLVAEGVPTPWMPEPEPRAVMPRCGTVSLYDDTGSASVIEDNLAQIRQLGDALRRVTVKVLGFTVGFGADGKLAILSGPGIFGIGAGTGTASGGGGRTAATMAGSGCACSAPNMSPARFAEGSEEAGSWALIAVGLGTWWGRARRRLRRK